MTGQVPFRCHACNWRVWRDELGPGANGPREIHRELTDSQIARLELDNRD